MNSVARGTYKDRRPALRGAVVEIVISLTSPVSEMKFVHCTTTSVDTTTFVYVQATYPDAS